LFNAKKILVHDSARKVYRLTELDGSVTEYDDFTGAFLKRFDPAGNSIVVTSLAGNGINPGSVRRTCSDFDGNTTVEQFSYTYGAATGDYLLTKVLLRRKANDGAFQNVAQASYTYYADGETNGSFEDLKTVTTQLFTNDAWQTTGTTYYRYWNQFLASPGSS